MHYSMKHAVLGIAAGAMLLASSQVVWADGKPRAPKAKNVILMISDGQGFNVVRATNYFTGTTPVYETFGHKFAMNTSSAGKRGGYTGVAHDPARMATDFAYAKSGATDSASAATALYTGVKNYDNEVNYTPDLQVLTTFFEKAAKAGKAIGAVSSVEFTHATPVAVFGHNSSRNNYSAMAIEAIYGSNPVNDLPNSAVNPKAGDNNNYDSANYHGNLKVVIGTGHPAFDANGRPQTPNFSYVGGLQAWTDLKNGVNGWTLIESKEDFEDFAGGAKTANKLFGVARNISTLQQGRSAGAPMLANQPTLVDMTRAALNVLDDDKDGFAVMIEGGAVDWAGHANQLDRIIEEQIDFNNAVQAVVDYLDNNTNGNNWGNTLLIVTADHETGYLWGDGTGSFFDVNGNGIFDDGIDYAHITDKGVNTLPGGRFYSGDHSNSLVPLYAKGARGERFNRCMLGKAEHLRAIYNLDDSWSGKYIDNTCVYEVMKNASLEEE